uniref:DUF281 domain-containing protein n=1 Tax=Rhabditophanes sp. KR3021 TaxID=114890 RepID=A0AC35TG94_9BILA
MPYYPDIADPEWQVTYGERLAINRYSCPSDNPMTICTPERNCYTSNDPSMKVIIVPLCTKGTCTAYAVISVDTNTRGFNFANSAGSVVYDVTDQEDSQPWLIKPIIELPPVAAISCGVNPIKTSCLPKNKKA